jgi:hypothetical protein
MSDEQDKPNPDLIVAANPDELHPVGKIPYGIAAHLREFGITTYSELSTHTPSDLQLRYFSKGAIVCLEAELNRRNLTLRDTQQPVAPFNPTMPSPEPDPAQTPPGAAQDARNPGLTSNWGTSDPTPPAPNGGWHAGLTAKTPTVSATAPKETYEAAMKAAMAIPVPLHSPEQATLRDQFAMATLTGIMFNLDRLNALKGGYRELNIREYCETAYALADGMMKARQEGGAR